VPFITALFDIGDELPDKLVGLFSIGPDVHASRIIHWYLKQEILEVTDPAERVQTVLEVLGGEGEL